MLLDRASRVSTDTEVRMKMATAATAAHDPEDPVATWTYEEFAEHLARTKNIHASRSQLWRILAGMEIRVVGLYQSSRREPCLGAAGR